MNIICAYMSTNIVAGCVSDGATCGKETDGKISLKTILNMA